jgi:heptosyltransferase II
MKILIEVPSWLGDAVMITPAIETLLSQFDKPEITLVGSFGSVELLKNHPKVIRVTFLKKNFFSLFKTAINLGNFDVYFSFRTSLRAKFFKSLISSNIKYQFVNDKNQNIHQVKKYNDFINESLSINTSPGKLIIHRDNNIKKEVLGLYRRQDLTLGINPGASYGSAKRWYPNEFAEVAAKLSKKYNIIIFGGYAEQDIAKDIENLLVKKNILNYQNLAGRTSIEELIEHISNLDLFITGDSGPMHIAAALGVPTVSIFGPTKAQETSQWMNKKSLIVKKDLACQPCMNRTCYLKHHNCMKYIKSDEVLSAVNSIN